MFCEMTRCDVISCSMADVYRCFVRWPCAMWCHAGRQMCTDVLWDNPVWCNIMQYGRYVQMFCEMTLWNVMPCSMIMWTDVLWEHAAGWMWLTVQDSSPLDCFSNTSVRTSQLSGSISPTETETLIPPWPLSPIHHATQRHFIFTLNVAYEWAAS